VGEGRAVKCPGINKPTEIPKPEKFPILHNSPYSTHPHLKQKITALDTGEPLKAPNLPCKDCWKKVPRNWEMGSV